MTTASLTEYDVRVRDSVMRQLDWDPEVDASAVGVAAKNGIVTLAGFVDTYAGKLNAERAAKRAKGVRAVANELVVRPMVERTDVDIAKDCARALELRTAVPKSVQVVVRNGHVSLTGTAEWLGQKLTAEKAVRHVRGVVGVQNYIEVVSHAIPRDVRHRIVEALHRSADFDARHITVDVEGHVATLRGHVGSWLQRDAAEQAAGSAPGISRVDNLLTVELPPHLLDEPEVC